MERIFIALYLLPHQQEYVKQPRTSTYNPFKINTIKEIEQISFSLQFHNSNSPNRVPKISQRKFYILKIDRIVCKEHPYYTEIEGDHGNIPRVFYRDNLLFLIINRKVFEILFHGEKRRWNLGYESIDHRGTIERKKTIERENKLNSYFSSIFNN